MCKQEQAASEDLGDLQPPLLEKEASVHQNQYRYIYIWYYCQHRYVVKECSIDPSPQDQLFLDPVRMSALVPSLMNKVVFGRAPLQLFQLHFKNSTMEQLHHGVRLGGKMFGLLVSSSSYFCEYFYELPFLPLAVRLLAHFSSAAVGFFGHLVGLRLSQGATTNKLAVPKKKTKKRGRWIMKHQHSKRPYKLLK